MATSTGLSMTGPTKKRIVLDRSKNTEAALALRTARKAAGYKSASAAAEACGFTNAKYRSHEAGSRPMTSDEAAIYAAAFNVDTKTILDPMAGGIREVMETVESQRRYGKYWAKEGRRRVGNRLKIARLARGHDSARQAGLRFELTLPTYFGHEAGNSAMSTAFARLYAAIFGVRESWLLYGHFPSGLGSDIDHELSKDIQSSHAPDLRRLAPSYSPPSDGELAKLKSATKSAEFPDWTNNAGDVLKEIDFSTFRQHGLDAITMKPNAFWPLPKGFVRSAFDANLEDILVVVPEHKASVHRARDRLFIDIRRTSFKEQAELFVLKSGEPCLIEGGPTQTGADIVPVGCVVAKFTSNT